MIRGTLYMHKVLESDGFTASGDEFYSIPNFSAHLQVSKRLFRNLSLMTNLSYSSKCNFTFPDYIFMNGEPIGTEVKELPQCFLADIGASYQWKAFEFSIKCKNLFNKKYRLGGDRVPVLQEGRNFMATVTLNLLD